MSFFDWLESLFSLCGSVLLTLDFLVSTRIVRINLGTLNHKDHEDYKETRQESIEPLMKIFVLFVIFRGSISSMGPLPGSGLLNFLSVSIWVHLWLNIRDLIFPQNPRPWARCPPPQRGPRGAVPRWRRSRATQSAAKNSTVSRMAGRRIADRRVVAAVVPADRRPAGGVPEGAGARRGDRPRRRCRRSSSAACRRGGRRRSGGRRAGSASAGRRASGPTRSRPRGTSPPSGISQRMRARSPPARRNAPRLSVGSTAAATDETIPPRLIPVTPSLRRIDLGPARQPGRGAADVADALAHRDDRALDVGREEPLLARPAAVARRSRGA